MDWSGIAIRVVAVAGIGYLAWRSRRTLNVPRDPPLPTSLEHARKLLENWLHEKAEPLLPARRPASAGAGPALEGLKITVHPKVVGPLLERLHERWRAAGYFLFQCERGFGFEGQPDRVALLPTADPWTVLRHRGTNGVNYDHDTEDVIAWLQALEREQPFVLTAVAGDWVQGRFLQPVHDPRALAERIYQFCPDVVDQGLETVEALADDLARTRTLYLWWD